MGQVRAGTRLVWTGRIQHVVQIESRIDSNKNIYRTSFFYFPSLGFKCERDNYLVRTLVQILILINIENSAYKQYLYGSEQYN